MTPNDSAHDRIWQLLPWYVNQSLDPAEREQVQAHLRRCPLCREEVGRLTLFATTIARSPTPPRSPRASYTHLMDRIQQQQVRDRQEEAGASAWGGRLRQVLGPRRAGIRLAFALLLLVLILPVGWRQWQTLMAPRFRTLADSSQTVAPSAGDMRVVFDSALGPAQIEALLQSINGTRLSGPDAAGVYTVRLSAKDQDRAVVEAAIARLRSQPGVLLVEPVRRP